ncbi:hypothetical protein OD91_1542 [Lutibacter sp. Hel_I_33_5]|uniref:hypothetical protein n=1 Tax=Lutibacter sp. Hel_I_33_5 TaxID=1566289 RepID=UPI00119DB96A|nr:hypothetical protein [Lutibacter sp. Hel_I_33_5]TVZ56260.1 hypothetical protein OD91_1542 [Lutibacter sp. Hel_I_33_5]
MNLQNDNFNTRNTLDVNTEKRHNTDLGLKIPEDYFSKSKQSILNKIADEEKGKVVPLYRNLYVWSAAAVIALLFTVFVFNPFESQNEFENDILIASLVTEDANVDQLLEEFVNDELLTDEIFSE